MKKIKINYDIEGTLLTFAMIETDTSDSEITCLRVSYNKANFNDENDIFVKLSNDFNCEYDTDKCDMLEEIVNQAFKEMEKQNERID